MWRIYYFAKKIWCIYIFAVLVNINCKVNFQKKNLITLLWLKEYTKNDLKDFIRYVNDNYTLTL